MWLGCAAVFASRFRQGPPCDPDGRGIDPCMRGEGDQQFLVTADIIQDAGEEMPFPGRLADLGGPHAGQGQETPQSFLILGDETKRLNCQYFRHLGSERS